MPLEQERARGVDEVSAPVLRTHHHRLQAVWDLSLGQDFSSDRQLQALLVDATTALGAEYAELYSFDERRYLSAGSADATTVLDLANYAPEYALGSMTADVTEPLLVGDTDQEAIWGAHPLVITLPLRSVLVMPVRQHSGKRHALIVAWKDRRSAELTEDETRYVKFFQRIITRLLENLEREREITSRIVTDHLTGLYNRAAMMEQISIAVSASERTKGSFALLYVDLDGFKELNDNYGHALGDVALQQAAARMRAVLRKHESAGRVGGDEFALLITQFEDAEQLAQIAKRVLSALRDPIVTTGAKAKITASIGIAVYPDHGTTPEELIEHADRAMYQAKRRNGDGFAIYGAPEVEPPVHSLLAGQLASAVMDREFFLCYQPIVYARTGRPLAAEALLRWLHPAKGMLSPHKFLDESRDAQILNRIENWVLTSALEKQSRLRTVGNRLVMHINVSEANPELLDFSHESLPDVRLEISENAIADDEKAFLRFINLAKDRGLRVGLSSFGAGRLPLGVLAELPLEFVKVTPEVSAPVVETAHRFGWMVIAESVENVRQRDILISLGVDALQGYQVCSPLAESDFDNWLDYQRR